MGLGIKKWIRSKKGVLDYQEWPKEVYATNVVRYWAPNDGASVNFGDDLSRVLINRVLSLHGLSPFSQVDNPKVLLGIGSVLHFASNDTVVWGSGANVHEGHERNYPWTRLDVRAVRGPRTRKFLQDKGISVPEVFGDPALLVPRLFEKTFTKNNKKGGIAVVPNFADMNEQAVKSSRYQVISPMQGWNKCIQEISEASFIVASSLHGLILADAFGIPSRYVRFSDREGLFKYHDYYEGTGRNLGKVASNIDEALDIGACDKLSFDSDRLLNAFPIDLWV